MEENKPNTVNQNPNPTFMNKKNIYIALAGVLVLLVLGLIVRGGGDNADNQLDIEETNPDMFLDSTTSTPTSTSTTAPAAKNPTPVKTSPTPLSATQKYLDAIRIYKNTGYYFQFVECHGLPGSLTMKKGKKFMLDNRDNKTRKIAIQGGQSFKVGAYGFAVATAPSKAGTYYITCDGGGAAKIVVQQ